jgi:hypothetical protein
MRDLLTRTILYHAFASASIHAPGARGEAPENPARWRLRAVSSVGEHFLDTEGVTGSIPVPPTILNKKAPLLNSEAF